MQSSTDLQQLLRSIDHKSYPAYKSRKGIYRFPAYTLSMTMCRVIHLHLLHTSLFRFR